MKNEQNNIFLCLENVPHFEIQIFVMQVEKIKDVTFSL